MLENYKPSERIRKTEYCLEFVDENENGFSFPCNKNGTLKCMQPEAKKNYDDCINGRYPKLIKKTKTYNHTYIEPATGVCDCGRTVYMSQDRTICDCGKNYNLYGQELIPLEDYREDWEYEVMGEYE